MRGNEQRLYLWSDGHWRAGHFPQTNIAVFRVCALGIDPRYRSRLLDRRIADRGCADREVLNAGARRPIVWVREQIEELDALEIEADQG
jgi:hypothetical protein